MHPNPRRIIPVILVLAALAAAAWWFFGTRTAAAATGAFSASGSIEATQTHIAAELGGRVVEVIKGEGDSVSAGEVLVQFDTALLETQRAQAQAALEVARTNANAQKANATAAQANLAAAQPGVAAAQAALDAAQANLTLLKAGATAEQIRAAEAQVAQAEANRQAALANFSTLTTGARPEDIAATQTRLTQASQEYYSMTVVLSTQQIEEVRAAMTKADGNLAQVKARKTELEKDNRTPPSALQVSGSAITDAQAALDAATLAYQAVQEPARPFYLQIEAARKAWEIAQLNLTQAKARQTLLQADSNMIQEALDAADATVTDAQDMVDSAKKAYDTLASGDLANRLKSAWDEQQKALAALNALGRAPGATVTVATALNQLDAAAALQETAAANLQNLKNGARPEQIAAAQAQVDAAQAQLESAKAQIEATKAKFDAAQATAAAASAQVDAAQAALDATNVQLTKMTLKAPADGIVLSRSIEPGEFAAPGAPLLVLAQLNTLNITVYIPEDRYGTINLGQNASVTVDSFPGVTFTARVTHIADQAEFTPRNVQTSEGRRSTVFAIKLTIANPDGKLKPGMPADVKFGN